jgi:hypothetical protein
MEHTDLPDLTVNSSLWWGCYEHLARQGGKCQLATNATAGRQYGCHTDLAAAGDTGQ